MDGSLLRTYGVAVMSGPAARTVTVRGRSIRVPRRRLVLAVVGYLLASSVVGTYLANRDPERLGLRAGD